VSALVAKARKQGDGDVTVPLVSRDRVRPKKARTAAAVICGVLLLLGLFVWKQDSIMKIVRPPAAVPAAVPVEINIKYTARVAEISG